MKIFWTTLLVAALTVISLPAQAQETGIGPGTVGVTIIPGGGMFFVNGNAEPSFNNFNLGGAVSVNANRYVGFEGEVNALFGFNQPFAVNGTTLLESESPDMLNYTGNIILSMPTGHGAVHGAVPYIAAGAGGLTMYKTPKLGVNAAETFLTGNVGGGLKWFSSTRFGVRADYRFVMVRASNNTPAFFGQEDRYAHRIYGGVIVNVDR